MRTTADNALRCCCHASREIIELDGEAGLLFVVRAMGVLLASEPGFSVWGYELSVFDEQHGEGSGRALLEREAASDASVGAYLEDVRRYEVRLEQERGQRAQLADESAGRTADGARMSGHEDLQLETLRRSARAGDAGTLLRALESLREAEPDQLHGAGSTALELLEECPALPGAAIVLEIYAWNPCAHCRGLALEELLRLGACPRWVLDEAAHDGTPWIRELAASARSPQPPPPAVS